MGAPAGGRAGPHILIVFGVSAGSFGGRRRTAVLEFAGEGGGRGRSFGRPRIRKAHPPPPKGMGGLKTKRAGKMFIEMGAVSGNEAGLHGGREGFIAPPPLPWGAPGGPPRILFANGLAIEFAGNSLPFSAWE